MSSPGGDSRGTSLGGSSSGGGSEQIAQPAEARRARKRERKIECRSKGFAWFADEKRRAPLVAKGIGKWAARPDEAVFGAWVLPPDYGGVSAPCGERRTVRFGRYFRS